MLCLDLLYLLYWCAYSAATSNEGRENLGDDYPVLLLEPRDAGQILSSGSGSGSGSGDLQPVTTPNPMSTTGRVPEYGTTFYITLTFLNLSKQSYEDNDIGGRLTDLLVQLLELDVVPLVVFDEDTASTILVYFPIEISSAANLQAYAEILSSTADPEWRRLVDPYVSPITAPQYSNPLPFNFHSCRSYHRLMWWK